MKALQLTGHGNPSDVVKLVDVDDPGAPGPEEVVIDVEASPIEPTDLSIIAGDYGLQPPLPHFLGAQGVGRVSAVGSDVSHVKVGDRTLVPPLSDAWTNKVKTNAPWIRPLPDGDVNQFAMLGIDPPTAGLLLSVFVQPKAGDWVLQNGANSGVGRSVISIAKSQGIKTVNVVRRPEVVDELTALGADVVLVDGADLPVRVAEATGGAEIGLALDCVGGVSTQRLLDSIGTHGTVAVYSGMSGELSPISNPQLVYTGKVIRGFWLVDWFQGQTNFDAVIGAYNQLAKVVATGAIKLPIAGEFTLDQYAEALARAAEFRGKVILKPNN